MTSYTLICILATFKGQLRTNYALMRLKSYLRFDAKRALINSYIISKFHYCPLVWIISIAKSLNKIKKPQKRALSFLSNNYSISYEVLER